ncbi:hypothetical protein GCM10023149_28360 [Mucilaginibacter gynuensis]|uniref:Uncharacterized protein n=1 Tax=Mucilaginibacter gynuensis TaxID=1302236 RepID=A0ABP8GKA4_9SPHI
MAFTMAESTGGAGFRSVTFLLQLVSNKIVHAASKQITALIDVFIVGKYLNVI